MAAVKQLNQNAEIISSAGSLFMNINAAKGLHDVMKTNLGGWTTDPFFQFRGLAGGAPHPARPSRPARPSHIWVPGFPSRFLPPGGTAS